MRVSSKKKQILKTMGIPIWTAHRDIAGQKPCRKALPDTQAHLSISDSSLATTSEIPSNTVAVSDNTNTMDNWATLEAEMSQCESCVLSQTRNNVVKGVGNKQADLMIIGEAPGVDEDLKGEPFVGLAGKLLNQMLLAMRCSRDSVYITNLLKCSPPDNRKPAANEIQSCSTFLTRQIQLIQPKIILSVGAVSAKNILNRNERIGLLRGQLLSHEATSTPVIATFHPAYLLRKPTEKRTVWKDLVLVKKQLSMTDGKANSHG